MKHFNFRKLLTVSALLAVPLFAYLFWHTSSGATLASLTTTYQETGTRVQQDFQTIPTLPLSEKDATYEIADTTSDGIDIQFANQTDQSLAQGDKKPVLNLSFPKDYSQPIDIKLDDQKTISITDLGGKKDYQVDTLSEETPDPSLGSEASKFPQPSQNQSLWQRLLSLRSPTPQSKEEAKNYLRYQSKDGRKSLLYAYQKDQATGEKKLKHWTLYREGNGVEQEEYQFKNAKVRVNDQGVAEVFYYGDQDIKNQQAASEVDSNLMERAQRTLEKEMGDDIMNGTSGKTPDFTIPKPYYIDKEGNKHDAEWKWHEETSSLSVNFTPDQGMYPVALDPTLSFTVPSQSNTGSVIEGESGSGLGYTLTVGDFNADGKTDLVVGAPNYSTNTGRAYIFYSDGQISNTAGMADVIIVGETTNNYFGGYVTAGDVNADGRDDLIVSAYGYSTNTGRAYLFYNDGSIPTTAATADVTITGGAINNYFGYLGLTTGDWNADGRTDLAVGAYGYSTNTGRAYLFYNDGSIPTTAATADVTITGATASDLFGINMTSGDFNADGRTDLAVGASGNGTDFGRVYIFYNDGSIPTTAATADVAIAGENKSYFGVAMTSGDFNADGKIDLAVGGYGYLNYANTGRAYVFYNDGSYPAISSGADIILTGETTNNNFGGGMISGDFNDDGRTDLAIAAARYSTYTGRVYIFYNDGSFPATSATADVIITGEMTNSYFGMDMAAGDMNADGRIDLAVGAPQANVPFAGRTYIFYSQNGQVNTNQSITGGATSDKFGYAMTTGDFNADGRPDLAVGATGYNPGAAAATGRTYIFYGDGQIPGTTATADITITGGASGDAFGNALVAGDFNFDGKVDLAVGANGRDSGKGSVYLFYNDGSIPTTAATADVTITNASSGYFGTSLTSGDFNLDGRTDLAVGEYYYSSGVGRMHIFYNDGSIPTTSATADVTITGESGQFGQGIVAGDFNADGRPDLAVAAPGYSTNVGRAYIFYADGTNNFGTATCSGSPAACSAANADVIITGEANSFFGTSLTSGDFNADGGSDLAVGAYGYSSVTGRAYLFYGDGSVPTTAATADVIITGESSFTDFGWAMTSGDLNADGRTDLVVSADRYSSYAGRAYIFYNDGSIPTTAATADVTITGETTNNYFGSAMTAGDMNGDGRADLIVGAYGNSTSTGKVYFYETRENFAWTLQRQLSGTSRTGTNGTGQELQITGETSSGFSASPIFGDFNADGRTDLAVGASNYSSSTGRVYLFYDDGSLSTGASSADVVITGEASSNFGISLAPGDFNADGKTDLAVGALGYSTNTGRAYIFYNDGSIPTTAATADVTITGETTNNYFGYFLAAGDWNTDGKTDLAVGAAGYSSFTGRAYIFYNDGSIPTTAATADVTITGGAASDLFSASLTAGDFNADGRTDLAVGAYGYSTSTGRAYIFYNDGSIPTTAATADITITGETTSNNFGTSLTAGDFNADGRTDLAVGASNYSSSTGRAYIFYNDGSIPTTAATADITITGEAASSFFGMSLAAGDFNADGRTDLAVGAYGYSSSTGRAYIFYNDGSIPTTAATADITITGETTSNNFGRFLAAGDWNADRKTDLAVGATGYSSNAGRVYMYTFNDPVITGETTNNWFGYALAAGDFNADGRTDLAVGAPYYSSQTGRVYVFYGDGIYPSAAASADVVLTGETAGDRFGYALASGDFNADGKADLVASAPIYSSSVGRAYIFYNGSFVTQNASAANVIITGVGTGTFGTILAAGDLNTDGKTDIVVVAQGSGKVFIFNNDGSYPATSATADVTITGGSEIFSAVTGDFNADGKVDLAVGDVWPGSHTGGAYIFYGDGSIPTTFATADVAITGETAGDRFGGALAAGDFNADGKTDLAVGAYYYSTFTGRVYVFYADGTNNFGTASCTGSSPTACLASNADVAITGEASNHYFGTSLAAGDWNVDGKTDLIVGAPNYSANTGRAYIFYNDGSIPTTAATADVTTTGVASSSFFGYSLISGDFNADGNVDLAVGGYVYSTNTGQVNIFASEVAASLPLPGTSSLKGTGKLKGTMSWK